MAEDPRAAGLIPGAPGGEIAVTPAHLPRKQQHGVRQRCRTPCLPQIYQQCRDSPDHSRVPMPARSQRWWLAIKRFSAC